MPHSTQDDIIVHAAPAGGAEDALYLLKSASNRKLTDDHVWLSVFSRPVRSRFTRAQRVTVCAAMLYLCFLANAMFYGNRPGRPSDSLFEMGPLGVDPYDVRRSIICLRRTSSLICTLQMSVGLISSAIVFLPVALAILLFKRSRPYKRRENRLNRGLDQGEFTQCSPGARVIQTIH